MENEDFESLLRQHTSKEKIEAARKEKEDYQSNPKEIESPLKHYPKVQRSLDLHGYHSNEAQKEICRFLANARSAHLKTVQIITGKGWHSPNFKAVLPKVTEQLLADFKQKKVVYSFKREKSGGSFLIYLA